MTFKPTKLTITNFKEFNSTADKSEAVKAEAKSNHWNWKTAIVAVATAAVNVISRLPANLRPIRQCFNHWNWRKKTAIVTTFAIIVGVAFAYQYKAHAAVLLVPTLVAKPAGFFMKFFIGYAIGKMLNTAFSDSINKLKPRIFNAYPAFILRHFIAVNIIISIHPVRMPISGSSIRVTRSVIVRLVRSVGIASAYPLCPQ